MAPPLPKIVSLAVLVVTLVLHLAAFATNNWISYRTAGQTIMFNATTLLNISFSGQMGLWNLCASVSVPVADVRLPVESCTSLHQELAAMKSVLRKVSVDPAATQERLAVLDEAEKWLLVSRGLGMVSLLLAVPAAVLLALSCSSRTSCRRPRMMTYASAVLCLVSALFVVAEVAFVWVKYENRGEYERKLDSHLSKLDYTNVNAVWLDWGIYSEAVSANLLAIVAVVMVVVTLRQKKENDDKQGVPYAEYRYRALRDADQLADHVQKSEI